MLEYEDLNENEKRILRESLHVTRIHRYYLEDNNILLMESEDLFEYIYLDVLKKFEEAIQLIKQLYKKEIKAEDVGKKMIQKILEDNNRVIKLSNKVYAYKDII